MFYRDWLNFDPWRELNYIQEEMNRLFERGTGGVRRRVYPAVNIWTNPEAAVVTAELPGFQPDDIHLSVVGDELRIHGQRRKEELKEGEQYHRRERGEGEFERSVRLPFAVESDRVEARFHNGILNILLPRLEADKPKKIQIKTH